MKVYKNLINFSRRKNASNSKRYEQPTPTPPHTDPAVNEYAEVKETQQRQSRIHLDGIQYLFST